MILTASPLGGNHPLLREQRICDSIEFKAEITGEALNQLHQFLGWINQLEAGVEAIRTDVGATPAAQRIKIDIAGTFNFPG